jgi:uncharacterized protein (TIGR02246 family)
MRSRFALVSIVVAFLWAGCASQPVKRPQPVRNLAAEVVADFEPTVAAWNAGNLNGFMAIYADDATFALPESFLQGRAAIGEYYAPLFQPGATRDKLSFDEFNVEVLSLDVILVRAIYRNTQNGQLVRRGTTTLIFRHILNHWRIIHDQSS